MVQYERYRDRYRNDDDRRERKYSGEEYYRREYRPYAISEYAGGQYEYGRGVEGTEVTLDGTVPSRKAKRRAEDCVASVSGVTHVQNNLRVKA